MIKPVREWAAVDLLSLPTGEFDWLEIKGRKALDLTIPTVKESDVRETLSKALSAFANSGGGMLVYGLADPRGGWHLDDGGVDSLVQRPGTREWIEDLIPNLVDPPLRQFNVYVFNQATPELPIAEGRCVVVIEIGDSEQAPHQASDHRYYGRVGGKSRPLNHRFVSDIFNRRRDPIIELSFETATRVEVGQHMASGLHAPRMETHETHYDVLLATATNRGRVYAHYVNVIIDLPGVLVPPEEYGEDASSERGEGQPYQWQEDNTRRDVVDREFFGFATTEKHGPSWFDPILPGRSRTWEWRLPEVLDAVPADVTLRWHAYADNAPTRSGTVAWGDIPGSSP